MYLRSRYVLKYMEVLERLPFTAQKKIFDHLAKLADVRCLSSEEQEKYDESIKAVDDYYSGLYGSYVEKNLPTFMSMLTHVHEHPYPCT